MLQEMAKTEKILTVIKYRYREVEQPEALAQVKIYNFECVRAATSTSTRTRYKFGLINLSNVT